MSWDGMSIVLAIIAFFGAFAAAIAWLEAHSEAIRASRQAQRYEDYVSYPTYWQFPAKLAD